MIADQALAEFQRRRKIKTVSLNTITREFNRVGPVEHAWPSLRFHWFADGSYIEASATGRALKLKVGQNAV